MGVGMSCDRIGGGGWTVPLLALQVLLAYVPDGASRPPVTAALITANALVYLRPGALDTLLPRFWRVCFNPHRIIKHGDLKRFFLSTFYHLSENHFFFNMTSLLWIGIQLETSMGSAEFASMVASLLGLSQGITLLLCKGLIFLGDDTAYYDQYAAGFSGVLFGMSVVRDAWAGDFVILPWAELLLVQAFIPDAFFLGHLGGILAGLTYLGLKRMPDTLALLISCIANVASRLVRFAQGLLRSARRQVSNVGCRAPPRETCRGMWRCSTCSYDNSHSADICEMCSTPHEDRAFSRRRHLQAGGNRALSVEESHSGRFQRLEG